MWVIINYFVMVDFKKWENFMIREDVNENLRW